MAKSYSKERREEAQERSMQRRRHVIKQAKRLELDPERDKRRQLYKCRTCYYLGGIESRDIAHIMCSVAGCGSPVVTASIGGNKFCMDCCIQFCMCSQCGANLE